MKKSKIFLYFLGFISIISCIFFVLKSDFFKIKKINCFVKEKPCPEELKSHLKNLEKKSLFFTNLELEISNILGEESTHSLENISKEIPNKINLNFKKQQEPNPKFAQLVLEEDKISEETAQKILILLNSAENNKLDISDIKASEEIIILKIDNRQVLIKDNPKLAIEKLTLILEKFNFDERETEITEIDLRFKLPILRASKTQ